MKQNYYSVYSKGRNYENLIDLRSRPIEERREIARKGGLAKQEKFVQNLVKGMSQREAYKSSYNASNMKDTTIDSNASRLFADSKVLAR